MNKDIIKIKNKFIKNFRDSLQELQKSVSTDDLQWSIKGFLDIYKNLYTISSDTKVVSKILEIHLYPIISKFAKKNGFSLEVADKQNYYPDLTFIKIDDDSIKFAVDIKTTFRRIKKTKQRETSQVGFTLGSHGSYFEKRDSKKNIQYPYKEYSGHFCLAIVYTQAKEIEEGATDLKEMNTFKVNELGKSNNTDLTRRTVSHKETLTDITSVIKDLKFYFVEKWKIASDGQGSGNTANIGSTKTEDDLANEAGVFSKLGERYFDEYWKNYNKIIITSDNGESRKITNVWDYLTFKNEKEKFNLVGNGAKRKPKEYKNKK